MFLIIFVVEQSIGEPPILDKDRVLIPSYALTA
jgi:hypothetical protein